MFLFCVPSEDVGVILLFCHKAKGIEAVPFDVIKPIEVDFLRI